MAEAQRVDQILSALADPVRRQVIELLHHRPYKAGDLARQAGMSAPAMSRHLRLLRQNELIEETHGGADARIRTYRLKSERLHELKGWLAELEDLWVDQLDAFKRYAEQHPAGR